MEPGTHVKCIDDSELRGTSIRKGHEYIVSRKCSDGQLGWLVEVIEYPDHWFMSIRFKAV